MAPTCTPHGWPANSAVPCHRAGPWHTSAAAIQGHQSAACRSCCPAACTSATRSPRWGGGQVFHDPDAAGETAARAYLLTRSQFSDLAAQEMYRAPGSGGDLDLTEVVAAGRASVGPGRYETLVCPGALDGLPTVTSFTAPWRVGELPPLAPSAPYPRHLAAGLREAHGWSPARTVGYLAACSGAAGHWAEPDIAALLTAPEETGAGPAPVADAGPPRAGPLPR